MNNQWKKPLKNNLRYQFFNIILENFPGGAGPPRKHSALETIWEKHFQSFMINTWLQARKFTQFSQNYYRTLRITRETYKSIFYKNILSLTMMLSQVSMVAFSMALKPDSDRGATRHDEDFDILGARSWEKSPGLLHFCLCFHFKNTTGD